jgi:hypothetical protein
VIGRDSHPPLSTAQTLVRRPGCGDPWAIINTSCTLDLTRTAQSSGTRLRASLRSTSTSASVSGRLAALRIADDPRGGVQVAEQHAAVLGLLGHAGMSSVDVVACVAAEVFIRRLLPSGRRGHRFVFGDGDHGGDRLAEVVGHSVAFRRARPVVARRGELLADQRAKP